MHEIVSGTVWDEEKKRGLTENVHAKMLSSIKSLWYVLNNDQIIIISI